MFKNLANIYSTRQILDNNVIDSSKFSIKLLENLQTYTKNLKVPEAFFKSTSNVSSKPMRSPSNHQKTFRYGENNNEEPSEF